jgi:hypothetical protein
MGPVRRWTGFVQIHPCEVSGSQGADVLAGHGFSRAVKDQRELGFSPW